MFNGFVVHVHVMQYGEKDEKNGNGSEDLP